MENLNNKSYDAVLQETHDFFAAQGVSIIGEGYKEVASNTALFESYVENLTEGASANTAAQMAQLMENTNVNILKESSMTGIQPIASLSMPVIRKLWPKFALKEALETEVAKSPRFVVAYTKPYMVKGDEKRELVHGILGGEGKDSLYTDLDATLKKEFTADGVTAEGGDSLTAGSVKVYDFSKDSHVNIADTPSAIKKQPLDQVIIKATANSKVVNTHKRLGVDNVVIYPVSAAETASGAGDAAEGELIVRLNPSAATVTVAYVGTGTVVITSLVCGVSSEYNEEGWSLGFDIARQDIDIPTGQHINAPLPIEALNDMMALYNIDGTKETVDLMTNVFAAKVDREIIEFIETCLVNRPGNPEFSTYGTDSAYTVVFDCKPAAGYAGGPKGWREEIKPLIDMLAQKIKNETYLQSGIFTLVANPLEAQLLANVDWQFRGGQGARMDGVDVDYSVGTYVGANAYKVVASPLVPAGAMYLLFLPSSKTQMTYKYYPYTYSTDMGYIDPNRSRVPSVMMTKRHTFYEFIPAIGAIIVENNNGNWFNEYVSHKEYTGA